ncbi:MAG: hypothetical protein ACJ786_23065 [Catenulispora sp.]
MDVEDGAEPAEALRSARRRAVTGLLSGTRPMTHVYEILSGGWRATCWCGDTVATDNEMAGWTWVFAHECDL